MVRRRDHLCVCICTYRRAALLRRLLSSLETQQTRALFDCSVVVVDNDKAESARTTVEAYASQSEFAVGYYVEPEQNIALARNRAIANSTGHFVALIDDDEFPAGEWLLNLHQALNHYKADGVLGPVLPAFEREPPRWVVKGRFFERPSHPTGHVLGWTNTRSGNALLRRELFREDGAWFDPAFGRGGEDRNLFRRLIQQGRVFRWCNEAPVYETVPPNRWSRSVLLKRALLRGTMAFNDDGARPASVLKSAIAVALYTASLPLFGLVGQHVFMKYLIKDCDHLGKVLAFLGIDLVREKYLGGQSVQS